MFVHGYTHVLEKKLAPSLPGKLLRCDRQPGRNVKRPSASHDNLCYWQNYNAGCLGSKMPPAQRPRHVFSILNNKIVVNIATRPKPINPRHRSHPHLTQTKKQKCFIRVSPRDLLEQIVRVLFTPPQDSCSNISPGRPARRHTPSSAAACHATGWDNSPSHRSIPRKRSNTQNWRLTYAPGWYA